MASPVYDELNVRLAYRLGDPYKPGGGVVTFSDDGIAYPATFRDAMVLEAARRTLLRMGPRVMTSRMYAESYVRELSLTALETPLPVDCARVLAIDLYGKNVEKEPMTSGRLNSVYWQNTPMYRIRQSDVEADRRIVLVNVHKTPFTATAWYLREIPNLSHGGTEDLLFDTYTIEHVLDLAEVLGRRNHQEAAVMLAQLAERDIQAHKEDL